MCYIPSQADQNMQIQEMRTRIYNVGSPGNFWDQCCVANAKLKPDCPVENECDAGDQTNLYDVRAAAAKRRRVLMLIPGEAYTYKHIFGPECRNFMTILATSGSHTCCHLQQKSAVLGQHGFLSKPCSEAQHYGRLLHYVGNQTHNMTLSQYLGLQLPHPPT